jgi:hypothetical protein
MEVSSSMAIPVPPVWADPYVLDAFGSKEPPRGWRQSLKYFGPGLTLSASIVGSGELIATTTVGAQVGFALLWLVLFSCAVKVGVQIEFARWTIATGTPGITGYNKVPPRLGPISWINLLFILLGLSKVLQAGGIVGGTAIAFSVLFPIGSDPLSDPSKAIWHAIVVVGTITMLHSSVVYTFATVAFFIMGASVLHPQALVPTGNEMITTLARMYTDALGPWAMVLFLVGAIAVLGSTLWAAVPSTARIYANLLSTVGVFDWNDSQSRLKWIRGFTVVLPIVWGASSMAFQQPVLMIQIGGVMTGVLLLAVLVATWYLRRTETDQRVYGGATLNVLLILTTVAIAVLGSSCQ